MNQSSGLRMKVRGRMNQPTLLAIFSGKAAPITFGVISLKIMMSSATTNVAIDNTRPLSPKICKAIPVTKIGRMVLMRLLEMKVRPPDFESMKSRMLLPTTVGVVLEAAV